MCIKLIEHKQKLQYRATSKNKDKLNTNILVKCIDDNEHNQICLSYVLDNKLYSNEIPNLSSWTYATLIIEPKLTYDKQNNVSW